MSEELCVEPGCSRQAQYVSQRKCSKHYIRPPKVCTACGDLTAIVGRGLCKGCYTTPAKSCRVCGELRNLYAYDTCRECYEPPRGECSTCGGSTVNSRCMRCYYRANKNSILEQSKARYDAKKEQINQAQRERYRSDSEFREKAKIAAHRYLSANREVILQRKRDWYEKNKEKHAARAKEYREKNRESISVSKRRAYERRRDRLRSSPDHITRDYGKSPYIEAPYEDRRGYMRQYVTNRCKEDFAFALAMRCRHRVRKALKRTPKCGKTLEMVGCSAQELKAYIEAKFLPGMSWACFDRIHIDHIRPLASFDLSDPEQQRQAFHYTNLQPLWAEDNLKKRDKWED